MTRTELRVEALRMSCSRAGNPNVVLQAREFLAFLVEDEAPAQGPVATVEYNVSKGVQPGQGRRK